MLSWVIAGGGWAECKWSLCFLVYLVDKFVLAVQLIETVYIVSTGFNDIKEAKYLSVLKNKLWIEIIAFLNDPLKDSGCCKTFK